MLGLRSREHRYAEASCITLGPSPGAREVTRRLKVVDQESSIVLERRRADLAAEREHWGLDVFRLLSPELFRDPERWARLPEDGHFTLALVPVLTVLAGTSPRCRERAIDYLHAQSELMQETLLDALTRQERQRIARTSSSCEASCERTMRLRTWSRARRRRAGPRCSRAERIETWLGC